ncbi:MAG: isopeptide-forming domain-containing fimbrial protein [Methanobacteriaceae archaeon]|nr:isopeptide-forming domain-containing fimbrial protein [Methanobacteriaceae archaeon]MDP3035728.1 isopeptide-forming domain-containing fimbrial protein [Methanobacteriaceae archaeon]MDP3624239.1 isopeptide-forming domain-containing fimbrial protein [Methanobacteriaceae archaeon]
MIDSGLSGILTGGLYNNRSINLGATTGSIFFRSLIDIAFEDPANFHGGNPFLTSNDDTTNAVNIAAGLTNSPNNVTESSGTSITIVAPTIEKKLYAINGNTTNLTYFIKPGDLVTFSLRVVVPTTNLENFTINDFLPIPFFNATQVSLTNSTQGDTPPGVGQWCLASDDTLSSFLGRVPILTIGALDNTLSFSYGLVNSTDQNVRIAHILFTVNATNNPMADGLYLTNLMNIMYANSPGATFSDNSIISFITQEPALNITKGILNTTGAGTISPLPSILPINGNLTGADAGDKVTFVITIGNQGSYNAYNTIIKDNILSGFVNFNLISVAYGNGTSILNYTGNLTNATGLILNNIIPGNSTVLITYSVDVASNVYPRQIINNTAQITNYGSTDGGPNYVQDQSLFQDQASVTIADPTISKNLVNSTDPGTSGNNLTIGEQGTFRITVTLPEGQIQNLRISDILPSGLAYDGNYTIDLSGFNGTLGSLTFTVVGNNITFLFNGNSTILGDNNNSTNTFYINLKTVVLNNLASNPITGAALSKTNTVNLNWDNNPGSQLTTNYNFNVLQPQLNLIKTITPNPAVGGQIVTVRLNLTNNGLSPAYNITITDSLNGNAFNWATVVANSTPSGFSFNYNSSSGIVTYTDGTLLNGQNAIFTFNVTLMNNIISNSSYNNSATATYDSLNITTIPRTENRNYTVTNSTLLRTVAPSITKGIFNTSEIDSTGTNIFIGEVVTYQLNITIPAGVTQNLTIRDVLNNGLSYIQLRSLISRSSGNITATGFNFTSLNITDFQAINETTISPLTFSLGNVTNNNPNSLNETISLLFSVVLRNDAVNTGNRTIGNIGNIDFLNATNQSRTISSNTQNIVVRLPNLSVTKTASNTAPQGTDSITFTIVVRNNNGANVFEILIRGALSSSATQAFNNTAIINSSTYDPILENNTSTAEVKIKTADIAVIKSVNVSNPKYWSNVVFTICTINNGPNGATGVSIKDILPAGLKFISYTTTQGTYNHNTGIWDIGSLNNGSYVWLNIAAQVVKSNTAIINIASKYSENEYDPYPENDSDNATVHVAAAADLGIKKTVSAKSAYFGKKLYFTIIVQNWGPDTSTGVKVKDVLPKGLRFVSYTTNYGKYNHKTGIWNINLLPAHKIAKLTITFYGVRSGKKINVARVSSKTYDPIIRPGDSKVSSATVLIKRPKCHYHPHHSHQNTVPMQHTGLPFAALIMAILMIMGGFISSKKTKKITK